jgi:hypothetical protein
MFAQSVGSVAQYSAWLSPNNTAVSVMQVASTKSFVTYGDFDANGVMDFLVGDTLSPGHYSLWMYSALGTVQSNQTLGMPAAYFGESTAPIGFADIYGDGSLDGVFYWPLRKLFSICRYPGGNYTRCVSEALLSQPVGLYGATVVSLGVWNNVAGVLYSQMLGITVQFSVQSILYSSGSLTSSSFGLSSTLSALGPKKVNSIVFEA